MIQFLTGEGEVGIENQGLNRWGMYFVAGRPYEGIIVLLVEEDTEVILSLESSDGSRVYAEAVVPVYGNALKWVPVEFTLTPDESDETGRFAVKSKQPGTIWVGYASLHPGVWGRFKGLPVRKDIAECLKAQGLTVLRYGGSMINTNKAVEKQSPGSGYNWKKMLGPRQQRPPYWGTFYRYNSNGFGVIDFVEFCETAGFLCIPAINILERPEDVADLVEYLNGPTESEWGRRRAEDGHPQPYNVRYLQLGNEECDMSDMKTRRIADDYPERFQLLSDAALSIAPSLTVIISAWLYSERELDQEGNRENVASLLEYAKGKSVLWDIHIRGDGLQDADRTESFFRRLRQYFDEIDPANEVRFCVLEENGQHHDLQRVLAHAHDINTWNVWATR